MIPLSLIALVVLLLGGILWWGYSRDLTEKEAAGLRAAVRERAPTVAALLLLALLPALGVLVWKAGLGILILPTGVIWAGVATLLWERGIAPIPADAFVIVHPAPPLPAERRRPPRLTPEAVGASDDSVVRQRFVWRYRPSVDEPEFDQEITLGISKSRYERYRDKEPHPPDESQWDKLAAADLPEVRELAVSFYRLHKERCWSTLTQAENVLAFTQSAVEYERDLDDQGDPMDWPKYPIETLMERRGDCKDSAILAVAILKRLGFEVALLFYPSHCALGIGGADGVPGSFVTDPRTDIRYFYGEATAEGWRVGEVPKEYRGLDVEIVPVQLHVSPKAEEESTPDVGDDNAQDSSGGG